MNIYNNNNHIIKKKGYYELSFHFLRFGINSY